MVYLLTGLLFVLLFGIVQGIVYLISGTTPAKEAKKQIEKIKNSQGFIRFVYDKQIQLKKMGAGVLLKDHLTVSQWYLFKALMAGLFGLIAFFISAGVLKSDMAKPISIGAGIIGWFFLDLILRLKNKASNDEMMPDIMEMSRSVLYGKRGGQYIADALKDAVIVVENKRLKTALLRLRNDLESGFSLDECLDELELSFSNGEISSFCNGRTSKSDVGEYALSKLNYSFDATQLANMDADRRKQNFEENDFASKAKDYQEAKDKLWEHLKESSQGLFKRNIVDSVKTIANDLSSDFKDVQHSKDKMDAKEKELDQLSSEQILKYVINSYKVNIDDAQEKLSMHLDEYWRKKELDFKRALILQITNTDALSDSQREEIADMIQNYDVNNFKEQADSVFVRKRFLKGNLLGIRINDDEKLDIKRLARSYNDRIKRIVKDMSQSMNEDCFSQFKIWEEKLLAKINANLTELNPELKSLAEIIRIETENITELENNQTMIQASLDTIKDLMSWKEAEEE